MANTVPMVSARILVIDDEPDLRTLYELTLLREGYSVETAGDVQSALHQIAERQFDVVLTDMRLPDGSGVQILEQLRQQQRPERCIVITAHGSAENAVESLKSGAFDYLTKPVDLKQFRTAVSAALHAPSSSSAMQRRITDKRSDDQPSREAGARSSSASATLAKLAGESAAMRNVKDRILKVARSMAPVLVTGESGTGKELVAAALHANSHRNDGPWVAVNCSAIPENLLETEFFGAKKGAYTGSVHDRDGFFQAAKGGTLFLDEIGDLPLPMQSKLLRAIQERCVRPVGAVQEIAVDVRIVSATHKDLPEEVLAGRFRQDLYYRLNVIDIVLPPLRHRREDLPVLCMALLRRIAQESQIAVPTLAPGALEPLFQLPLHGNVRELENLLHRALALCEENVLKAADFQIAPNCTPEEIPALCTGVEDDAGVTIPADLQAHLDEHERSILIHALKAAGYNRTLAASRLGLNLRQIRYRISRLKIDVPRDENFDE